MSINTVNNSGTGLCILESEKVLWNLKGEYERISNLISVKDWKKNQETREKVNGLIKDFVRQMNDVNYQIEHFSLYNNNFPCEMILRQWVLLLDKCGYRDTPLDKIKKKIDFIIQKGEELQIAYQSYKIIIDQAKEKRGMDAVEIEKIHDFLLSNFELFKHFYGDLGENVIEKPLAQLKESLTRAHNTNGHFANLPNLKLSSVIYTISQILSFRSYRMSKRDITWEDKARYRVRYKQFDLELDNIIENVKESQSSDKVLRKTNTWLLDNLKWFYMNPIKDYIGEDCVIKSQDKLNSLYEIIKSRAKDHPILQFIKRILPRNIESLPDVLSCKVYKFLPADTAEDIQTSLSIIREKVKSGQQKAIALWVNQQKIPLVKLSFLGDELFHIAPHLTYMDLRGLKWYKKRTNRLIESSLSLISLCCRGTKVTKLPELLLLKYLDISETSIESIPLKTCQNLLRLSCDKNNKLKSIPACTNLRLIQCRNSSVSEIGACPRLETAVLSSSKNLTVIPGGLNLRVCIAEGLNVHIGERPFLECLLLSENAVIETLPKLPSLKKLSIKNCPLLHSVPLYESLITYIRNNCPKLINDVNYLAQRVRNKPPEPEVLEKKSNKKRKEVS